MDLRLINSFSRTEKRGSVEEVVSLPPSQAPQGKHGAALSRFLFQALNSYGNKRASLECCNWKCLTSYPVETLIFWGSLAGLVWGLTKHPQRRVWWVVFISSVISCHLWGGAWRQTVKKCMQESREDVLWCGDAGQNVLTVRQMEIHLSLYVCQSAVPTPWPCL